MVKSHYLHCVYDKARFKAARETTLSVVRTLVVNDDIDTLVFSGYSGASMAYWLAAELDLSLVCVRKPEEDSHYVNNMKSYYSAHERTFAEGDFSGKNFLVIDDFITSGNTMRRILQEIEKLNGLVGVEASLTCKGLVMFAAYPSASSEWEGLPVYRTAPPDA